MPTWREEIRAAFVALGGTVTYAQLYAYIEENTSRALTPEWKSTVRQVVETHSGESDNYRGGQDLFYPVNGIDSRSGVWGLKSMQVAPSTDIPPSRDRTQRSSRRSEQSAAARDVESIISAQENQEESKGNFDPTSIKDARERTLGSIVRRRGQPKFRRDLLKFYGGRCAITGTDAEQALEAAHIIPYKGSATNHPSNGLLLRADLHTLFDLKLIAIDTRTMTVLIAPALNSTSYHELANVPLYLPSNRSARPNIEALDIHRRETGL